MKPRPVIIDADECIISFRTRQCVRDHTHEVPGMYPEGTDLVLSPRVLEGYRLLERAEAEARRETERAAAFKRQASCPHDGGTVDVRTMADPGPVLRCVSCGKHLGDNDGE